MRRLLFTLTIALVASCGIFANQIAYPGLKNPNFLENVKKSASLADPSLKAPEVSSYDQSHQLMMGPSSIVHGCVNAITGSVFDSETDIEVPGSDLKLQRFFLSFSSGQAPSTCANYKQEPYGLFWHWTWNHSTLMTWRPHWNVVSIPHAETGLKNTYQLTEARFDSRRSGKIHPTLFKGWTNIASGPIGARFDMHNQKIALNENDVWQLTLEDGTLRLFDLYKESWSKKEEQYWTAAESKRRLPSGLHFLYDYTDRYHLKQICQSNAQNQPFVAMSRENDTQFKTAYGQSVVFHLTNWLSSQGCPVTGLLQKVERTHKPSINYEYVQMDYQYWYFTQYDAYLNSYWMPPALVKKSYPESRYIAFEYDKEFPKAWAHRGNPKRNTPSEHAGKVLAIKAPAGPKGAEMALFRFQYQKGKTLVFDGLGGLKTYHFNDQNRLTRIDMGTETPQPTLTPTSVYFQWGSGTHEGRLIKQWVNQAPSKGVYLKEFEYDSNGNVIAEKLHASITGLNPLFEVDQTGRILKEADVIETRTEYSQDAFHLPIRQIDHEGREIILQYVPQTDLVQAKLIKIGGKIVSREFFSYNAYACPELHIKDDGSSENPLNLEGVHVRLITRSSFYEEDPVKGMIKEKIETYLDIASGQEIELTKEQYSYTSERWLSCQKKYVAGLEVVLEHSYVYDAHGNVIQETREDGALIERQFDANDNMIFERGPDSSFETYMTYDQMNRMTQRVEKHPGLDLVWTYEYDHHNKLVHETDPWGSWIHRTYDRLGRLIELKKTVSVNEKGEIGCFEVTEKMTYDDYGHLISKQDANGFVETYTYNALGQLLYKHLPGEVATQTTYNLQGLKVLTELSTGARENYEYDGLHRLVKIEKLNSLGEVVLTIHQEYEGSLLASTWDSEGKQERFFYDGAGRVIRKEISKENSSTTLVEEYEYDGLHRPIVVRTYSDLSDFIEKREAYDALARVTRQCVQSAGGILLKDKVYNYDFLGRKTEEKTFENGVWAVSKFAYDSLGSVVLVQDALGHATHTSYDYFAKSPSSNVLLIHTKVKRADGSRSAHWLTPKHLCLSSQIWDLEDQLALDVKYGYTPTGQCVYRLEEVLEKGTRLSKPVCTTAKMGPGFKVVERVEAKGSENERITRWSYDDSGRLEKVRLCDGEEISYFYNEFGLLKRITSLDETIDRTLVHNPYGQLISVKEKGGASTQRQYDIYGNVTKEVFSTGYEIEKTYDGIGRVLAMKLPLSYSVNRHYKDSFLSSIVFNDSTQSHTHYFEEYDSLGRVLKESTGSFAIERRYDLLGRQVEIKTPLFETRIPDGGFDAMGHLVEMEEKLLEHARGRHFSYSVLGEITKEQSFSSTHACLNYVDDYDWNSRQQRLRKNDEIQICNELSELQSIHNKENEHLYTYDKRGRLISKRSGHLEKHFSYDAFDRLIEVQEGNNRLWKYEYDAFDRRVSKQCFEKGQQILAQDYVYDELFELGSIENGQWKEFRLIGLRQRAETGDSLLFVLENERYIPLHDLQGSVVGIYSLSKLELEQPQLYDVFGLSLLDKAEFTNPWGYVGKRLDPETGWVFFGKRYYMPFEGRWLTRDPKGEIDGSNLYAYLKNSPVYQWDLWGYSGIGVTPSFVYDHGKNQPELKAYLEQEFKKFEEQYPMQKYNCRFIAVLVEPGAEMIGESNGIATPYDEFFKRILYDAIDSNKNVIGVYNATEGFFTDFSHILNREISPKGYTDIKERPEYEMTAHMMRVGTQVNKSNGIDGFLHFPHSNGQFVSFVAASRLGPDEVKSVHIETYGGVSSYFFAPEKLKTKEYASRYDCARTIHKFQGEKRPNFKLLEVKREPWDLTRSIRHHSMDAPLYRNAKITSMKAGVRGWDY